MKLTEEQKEQISELVSKMCQARYDEGFADAETLADLDTEDAGDQAREEFFKTAEELEKLLGIVYWTTIK